MYVYIEMLKFSDVLRAQTDGSLPYASLKRMLRALRAQPSYARGQDENGPFSQTQASDMRAVCGDDTGGMEGCTMVEGGAVSGPWGAEQGACGSVGKRVWAVSQDGWEKGQLERGGGSRGGVVNMEIVKLTQGEGLSWTDLKRGLLQVNEGDWIGFCRRGDEVFEKDEVIAKDGVTYYSDLFWESVDKCL